MYHISGKNGNWASYKKQRNFCANFLRKTIKNYSQRLNVKGSSDNKQFWKTFKPYFSNKGLNSNKVLLKEGHLISDDKKLFELLMKLF